MTRYATRGPYRRRSGSWQPVRVLVRCAYGHDVLVGWVWFGSSGLPVCEACMARQYGIRRTADLARDGTDMRMKQGGD